VKPVRRILKNCSWEDKSISTALRTGNILKEPFSARIFTDMSGLIFIPYHIWSSLPEEELAGYWSVDILSSARTIIVPFESRHDFDWASPGETTKQENNFIDNTPGAIRITECADKEGPRNASGSLIFKKMGAHVRLRA